MLANQGGSLIDIVEALVKFHSMRSIVPTFNDGVAFEIVRPAPEALENIEDRYRVNLDISNSVDLARPRPREKTAPRALVLITPELALVSLCRTPEEARDIGVRIGVSAHVPTRRCRHRGTVGKLVERSSVVVKAQTPRLRKIGEDGRRGVPER